MIETIYNIGFIVTAIVGILVVLFCSNDLEGFILHSILMIVLGIIWPIFVPLVAIWFLKELIVEKLNK